MTPGLYDTERCPYCNGVLEVHTKWIEGEKVDIVDCPHCPYYNVIKARTMRIPQGQRALGAVYR